MQCLPKFLKQIKYLFFIFMFVLPIIILYCLVVLSPLLVPLLTCNFCLFLAPVPTQFFFSCLLLDVSPDITTSFLPLPLFFLSPNFFPLFFFFQPLPSAPVPTHFFFSCPFGPFFLFLELPPPLPLPLLLLLLLLLLLPCHSDAFLFFLFFLPFFFFAPIPY